MHLWKRINRPSTVLWWMYGGTGVTQTTQFMVMPFMALYMSSETGAGPGVVGLAVGMTPLTTTAFSFLSGTMSDKLGRRIMMTGAMLINAMSMLEFAIAHSVLMFFLVSFLTGLSRAFFGPASQAMMTDLTDISDRGRAFGLNYWMNNIGASLGPVLGGYFGTVGSGATFYAAAAVSLLYAVVIACFFPESNKSQATKLHRVTLMESMRTVKADKALFVFIIAGVLTSLGYSQFDTTFPQIMRSLFGTQTAAHQYAYIFAATGLEVVLLQFVINRLSDKFLGQGYPFLLSQVIYAISFFGFGLSKSFAGFLLWAVILTIGEVIVAPRTAEFISRLADERMIGTYFGAYSLVNLGFFVGPSLGGVGLHHLGGLAVFVIVGVLALCAGPMYLWSYVIHTRGHQVKEATVGIEREGPRHTAGPVQ